MILFEHERVRVGQSIDGHTLTQPMFGAIASWQERCEDRYFEIGHQSIRATQWVGVIQVGSSVIEVLPKADSHRGTEAPRDESIEYWKCALLSMVASLHGFKFRHSERADLQLQKHSLLEVFHWLFVEEAEAILREGLVKSYRSVQRNRSAWRGRLVVSEDIKRNLVHRERIFTEASEYDVHNAWNRILVAGLNKVVQRTRSHLLKAKTRGLLLPYLDWAPFAIDQAGFDRLHYDRRTERYRAAIELARLLLLDQNPDLASGHTNVVSLLFDMNKLWEAWVAQQIRRRIQGTAWSLKTQSVLKFWKGGKDGSSETVKVVKPDLFLRPAPGAPLLSLWPGIPSLQGATVLDTKWKTNESYVPGDDDLKQMYVYNKLYGTEQAFLLYPLPRGCFERRPPGIGTFQDADRSRCAVAYVELPRGKMP